MKRITSKVAKELRKDGVERLQGMGKDRMGCCLEETNWQMRNKGLPEVTESELRWRMGRALSHLRTEGTRIHPDLCTTATKDVPDKNKTQAVAKGVPSNVERASTTDHSPRGLPYDPTRDL